MEGLFSGLMVAHKSREPIANVRSFRRPIYGSFASISPCAPRSPSKRLGESGKVSMSGVKETSAIFALRRKNGL